MTDRARAFLDANVLAKAVTRSLLIIGAGYSEELAVTWSALAESEADRHALPTALRVSRIRQIHDIELGPTGIEADRYRRTSPKDRQILADAVACGATHLVTEDVDDFALSDIEASGIHAAVNPDLFMSIRLPRDAYEAALETICRGRARYPSTPAELHARIAKHHPRLFAAMATSFDVRAVVTTHSTPGVVFRGSRCLQCSTREDLELSHGLCPRCLADQVK